MTPHAHLIAAIEEEIRLHEHCRDKLGRTGHIDYPLDFITRGLRVIIAAHIEAEGERPIADLIETMVSEREEWLNRAKAAEEAA